MLLEVVTALFIAELVIRAEYFLALWNGGRAALMLAGELRNQTVDAVPRVPRGSIL